MTSSTLHFHLCRSSSSTLFLFFLWALLLLSHWTLPSTLALNDDFVEIVDAQVVEDSISDGSLYKLYKIHVTRTMDGGLRDVRLALTSRVGDAELFVSNDRFNGGGGGDPPSNTSWLWRGYDAGSQSLVITPQDPHWCDDCYYLMAVYAHLYVANYRLIATIFSNHSHVPLHRNLPINQALPSHNSAKYYYKAEQFPSRHDIRLVASPSYGAVEILVNVINDYTSPADPNIADADFPSPANFTWRGYSTFAGAFLHIRHNDPLYKSSCAAARDPFTGCMYLVVVRILDFSGTPAQYSLLLTQNAAEDVDGSDPQEQLKESIQLTNHISYLRGLAAGETEYYYTQTLEAGYEFYVTITVLSGSGNMYVSLDPDTIFPNNKSSRESTWNGISHGTFTYQAVIDSERQVNRRVPVGFTAYDNVTFLISVGMNPSSRPGRYPDRLIDGVPHADSLHDGPDREDNRFNSLGSWRYYVFYMPFGDGLTISVNKFMGDVEAYVEFQPWNSANNYTYNFVNRTNYDFALDQHALMAYNTRFFPAGKYLIGVFAREKCDYSITVTATYTDQFLLESIPTVGQIRLIGFYNQSSSYVFMVNNIDDQADLRILLTTLSGHARVFVSDTNPTWSIDPEIPSTYNWTVAGYDTRLSEVWVPSQQVRQGPYWIKIVAFQNTTYQVLAEYRNVRAIQAGLPQDSFIGQNISHRYFLQVPGGTHSHDWWVTVVPLHGHVWMYASNLQMSNASLPHHADSSSFHYRADRYDATVQHLYIPNFGCEGVDRSGRCFYAIEVWSPTETSRYNLVAYPYNSTDSNLLSVVLQHTVPNFGFAPGMSWQKLGSVTHYTFHVPEDKSDIFFALTQQDAVWNVNTYSQLAYSISRFEYPLFPFSGEWNNFGDFPAMFISSYDNAFKHPINNRTEAGIYYVSVFNRGDSCQFTLSVAVFDSMSRGTNDSSIMLVNNVRQAGFAQFFRNGGETFYQFFRLFHNNSDESVHVSMSQDVLLYHSVTLPYPLPGVGAQMQNSQLDVEWIEYPSSAGWHYFAVTALFGQFVVHPRIYRGQNDTSLLNRLLLGETQQARALPNYVIHYIFELDERGNSNSSVDYMEVQMEVLSGNPHAYINYFTLDQDPYYPSSTNNRWNITDPNTPSVWIYPALRGRYVISVQARSQVEAEWRISAIRHSSDIANADYLQLHSSEVREQWLQQNTSQFYYIDVPFAFESYRELRISLTSWYGEAELFVNNFKSSYNSSFWAPDYKNFLWRGYDAGSTSLIISSRDPNWCAPCTFFIGVYSNQISSFYSIAAQIHGNSSVISLRDHIPINAITGINSTSRFIYRPHNWQLQHGFRINTSPTYGAAYFVVNVQKVTDIHDFDSYHWPTLHNSSWQSWGYFEGTGLHITHYDADFCSSRGNGDDNALSNCIYLIAVVETTGFVPTLYTLVLNSVVPSDLITPDTNDYAFLRMPHMRLVNHVPIQQFAESSNITYYKTMILNRNTEIYVTLTVLSGYADIYISGDNRYPNQTNCFWSSMKANTTSWSFFIEERDYSFSELYIAVEAHLNTSYTILAGQLSPERLGRWPMRLTNGVPQFDTLGSRLDNGNRRRELSEWRYYVYYLPAEDALSFSVQKRLSEVNLYVSYDPLSTSGNNSYSQYQIPNTTNFDVKIDNHALLAYQWHHAPAGRYVFGVRVERDQLADYHLFVTAGYTSTVLTKDFAVTGYIRPNLTIVNGQPIYTSARYVLILPQVMDRWLKIVVTQLSGHVHTYVSNSTWNIQPSNASSYQWQSTGTRLDEIVIPPEQLRVGPYWILVHAQQDSTFSVLASEFIVTGLQLGLPITTYLPRHVSAIYSLTLPGGRLNHDAFLTVLPLVGQAFIYGTDVTDGWNYPNALTGNFLPWLSSRVYHYKPQTVDIYNHQCETKERCIYLFQVLCVVDCLYTINAYPWSSTQSNTTVMLQHTVPQYAFTGLDNGRDIQLTYESHFSFHVSEENSTVTIAFSPNRAPTSHSWHYEPTWQLEGVACISRFAYYHVNRRDSCEWQLNLLRDQVLRIEPRDDVFRVQNAENRTQAGVYYITVVNSPYVSIEYTIAIAVHDSNSFFTNDSSIVLVDGVLQAGFAPRPRDDRPLPLGAPSPFSWYRMYHENSSSAIHMKLITPVGAMDLYHSTVDPYPQNVSVLVDRKDSAIDPEWFEYPVVNTTHYFGAIADPGPFFVYPYLVNGPNATNVLEQLYWGEQREGRLPPGYTIYFNFYLRQFEIDDYGVKGITVNLEQVYAETFLFINYAPFNRDSYSSNVTYPFVNSSMWTAGGSLTQLNIYPAQAGEYLMAVHSYSLSGVATFRVRVNVFSENATLVVTDLQNNMPVTEFLRKGSFTIYRITVPNINRGQPGRRGPELRVGLTSWYGEAEMFISRNMSELYEGKYGWRSYDAGSSTIVINQISDENYCQECEYYIAVYANEINAFYKLIASWDSEVSVIELKNHEPLNWVVPNDSWQRFSFRPTNDQLRHGFRIHTTPSYGLANIAVNVVNASSIEENRWPRLNETSMWMGEGWTQGQWVHIQPTDPGFCNTRVRFGGPSEVSECLYLITVFGIPSVAQDVFLRQSEFTILLQTSLPDAEIDKSVPVISPKFDLVSPHTRLMNNVPLNQYQMNNTINYFKFSTAGNDSFVVLTVTAISGWTDFFVDDFHNPYPSPARFNWSTVARNESTLQFRSTGAFWGDSYFIAVYAWTNVTYTITLSQYPFNTRTLGRFPTRLTDGVPQSSTLVEYDEQGPYQHERHYVFYLPENEGVSLTVNKYVGEVDVYVLYNEFQRTDSDHFKYWQVPNRVNYTHALADHGLDAFMLPRSRAGRYAIVVYARHLADYSITMTAFGTPTILLKDTPTAGYIRPTVSIDPRNPSRAHLANAAWYILDVPFVWKGGLYILVTELSGHVDLSVWNYDARTDWRNNSTKWFRQFGFSTQLEPVFIPREELTAGQYWILVVAADDATFQILATDYNYAQLQLGLPQSAWIRGGDSHRYGIVVAGGVHRHDTFISAVPLLGTVALYATNVTSGFRYPNHSLPATFDYASNDLGDALQTVVLPTWTDNCTARRCLYMIELYCLNYTAFCRYDISAFSWNTSDSSNSSIVLRHNMPQPAFTGADAVTLGSTHFQFHVQLEHSNVSIFYTSLTSAGYTLSIGVSRYAYPQDPLGSDSEFHSGLGVNLGRPNVYFDYTDFSRGSSRGMSGGWYATIWNVYDPSFYHVVVNQVNDNTRGTNYSAVLLVDGLPQMVYLTKRQESLLFGFPISKQPVTEAQNGVSVTINGQAAALSDLYVTWDGSVPSPTNYQVRRLAQDVDTELFLVAGSRLGGCDNHVRDCFYLISAVNRIGETMIDNRFHLVASQTGFQRLESGLSAIGIASTGYPRNYSFYVAEAGVGFVISIQPSALFCDVQAQVEYQAYPNSTSPSTRYIEGARALRINNPLVGHYFISVTTDLSYCQYSITLNQGTVTLQEGVPFSDVLPAKEETGNYSVALYLFNAETEIDWVFFQVDSLSQLSRQDLFVQPFSASIPFPTTLEEWAYKAFWNQSVLGTSISVQPHPGHNSTGGFYLIAVRCSRHLPETGEKAFCGYEITAQLATSTRYLQDGVTIKSPRALKQGEFAYYRAFARPNPSYPNGWSVTVGKLQGQVSVFVSTTDRRPSATSFNKSSSMREFEESARVYLSYNELVSNPGGYVFIAVRSESSEAEYTIVSSLSAIFLINGVTERGYCDNATDQLFLFNLDNIAYRPVSFSLTDLDPPYDSLTNEPRTLLTTVQDARAGSILKHTWSLHLGFNGSQLISPTDNDLLMCTRNDFGCVLFINVTRCKIPTRFSLLVSAGNTPELLSTDAWRQGELFKPNLTDTVSALYDVGLGDLSAARRFEIYLDDCRGSNYLYVNYPNVEGYPTPASNSFAGTAKNNRQVMRTPVDVQPDERYRIAVYAQKQGLNRYYLYINTMLDITRPALAVDSLVPVGGDKSVQIKFAYATTVPTGKERYTLFYTDRVTDPNLVMTTRCGLEYTHRYRTWNESELMSLADATGIVTVTVDNLENGKVYAFALLLEDSYFNYDVTPRATISTIPAQPAPKISDETGPIILGVVLPVTLILAGVAFYLYLRNRKLQQELSVELPDVSATPSSAAARRRAQRSGGDDSDSFSRGGGDKYSSLLGEDETSDEASRVRGSRAGRGKKAPKRTTTTTTMEQEDDVPYRSDVV